MESTMAAQYNRIAVLEEKCETLLELAREIGADVRFHDVRRVMEIGRRYGTDAGHEWARAHLETRIAAANRKRIDQASRRPLTFVIAPIMGFMNWIRQG